MTSFAVLIRYPRSLLAIATASVLWATTALANPADIGAGWRINGNGYPGDLALQQAPDGSLSGSMLRRTGHRILLVG